MANSKLNRIKRKRFCVVQFKDKPFEGIDDYVCVPNCWVIADSGNRTVVVRYPKNEDPVITRGRVKRREIYDNEFRYYMANIKYESDFYTVAERWIVKRNHQDLTDKEDSEMMRVTQPEPVLDKKLRSSTRNSTSNSKTNKPQLTEKPLEKSGMPILKKSLKRAQSEPKEELNKKFSKLEEAANNTSTIVNNYANTAPGCLKTEQWKPKKFRNYYIEKAAAASSGGKTSTEQSTQPQSTNENKSVAKSDSTNTRHCTSFKQASKQGGKQPSPVRKDCQQEPSMPLLDVNEPIGVVNRDQEIQSESITEQRPSTSQIPLHASQQPRQPEYVHERRTSVSLCPENLLSVPRTQEISVRQFKETNCHSHKTQPPSNTRAALTTAPTTTNLFSQPYQDTRLSKVCAESYYLNSQPRDERDNTNNMPSTSHHLPESVKLSSGKPATKNPVDKKMHLENITRNIATAAQNSLTYLQGNASSSQKVPREPEMHVRGSNDLNSIDHKTIDQNVTKTISASSLQIFSNLANQCDGFVQQSNAQHDYDILGRNNGVQSNDHSVRIQDTINETFATQNGSNPANQAGEFHTCSHENTYLAVDHDLQQERLCQEPLRRSTEINNTVHGPLSRNSNVPSAVQISSNASIQFHQGIEQEIQLPPNHQYSQRDPRLTTTRVDISMKTSSRSQRPGPQGVTKQTLPPGVSKASNSMGQAPLTARKHYLPEDQQTQASLSRRSNEQNKIDVAAVPRNVTADTPLFTHNEEVPPTCLRHISYETQLTPDCQTHVNQNPRTQKRLVDQSTETNFTLKRIYFEDDIVRSPATENSPRVVDSACQTDESLIEEPLSTYQEVISDYEISTIEAPVGIVKNVESISPESDPAGRPTSENHQMHLRIILEQQMLNDFATLFAQMGSTLSSTCDMFNNLKSSILENAETYKRLFEAVRTFNSLGDFMITESPPSSVTSEATQETRDVERERSGNGGEDFNNSVNRPPTKSCDYMDLC